MTSTAVTVSALDDYELGPESETVADTTPPARVVTKV